MLLNSAIANTQKHPHRMGVTYEWHKGNPNAQIYNRIYQKSKNVFLFFFYKSAILKCEQFRFYFVWSALR